MNDKELREKTKHRTFTSMAQRRRWLALNEQIQENKKRTDWLNGKEEKMEIQPAPGDSSADIEVGDKVRWTSFLGDTDIEMAGVVESVGEFNGVKTFNVRKFEEFPAITMITASRVTKTGK